MVEIESYLRNPDESFITVEQCSIPPRDPDYIEGAIELRINTVNIIGKEHWDYVDQLWAYISNMLQDLKDTGSASTYFPDQPIKLSFVAKGGRVLVSLQVGGQVTRSDAERQELINALRKAGCSFFDKMSVLVPEHAASYAMAKGSLMA